MRVSTVRQRPSPLSRPTVCSPWRRLLVTLVVGCLLTMLGCGRWRFQVESDSERDAGTDAGDGGGLGDGGGADGGEDGGVDGGPPLEAPVLLDAEDEVFWDNGNGDGELVLAEGTGFVSGLSTVYLSADGVPDAGDIAQATTFVSETQLRFVVDRGSLPQGGMFLFVSNGAGLDSNALAISVGRMWNPTDATGVAGWWDAADASTIFEAAADVAEAGDGVSQWRDKSGNGNHFNCVAAVGGPVTGSVTMGSAGLNTVFFDADPAERLDVPSNATLGLDGTGGFNVFAAMNVRPYVDHSTDTNSFLESRSSAVAGWGLTFDDPFVSFSFGGGRLGSGVLVGEPAPFAVDLLFKGTSRTGRTYFGVNGSGGSTTNSGGGTNRTSVLSMGDNAASDDQSARFAMGELILVGGNLAQDVVQTFEGYLGQKWGIELVSDHPYVAKFTVVVFDP